MITMKEFKKTCNGKLQALFPKIAIYGNDTTDGCVRPFFYTEVIPHGYTHESKNYVKNGATFKATLFEQTHDEAYCLAVFDLIREAFGMVLPIGGRHLLVGEISYEFIGEYSNLLQISIEFDWMEQLKRREPESIMGTVVINAVKKGE